MNAELWNIKGPRGWIFYDAECPLCQWCLKTCGRLFAQRGYQWQPLQTPGLAGRLGIDDASLLDEMRLQLADRRVLGGVDCWIVLFQSVWWLWPLGLLMRLPGLHGTSDAIYRWVARHRYCLGGRCARGPRHRTIPFLDLP